MAADSQLPTLPCPVILVPGLEGTGLLFYRQVALLSTHHTVITARLRDDAMRMDELVADLHGLVSRAAPAGGRVTLIGESFGGALTLSYALAHPDRIDRLVILNSFPYFEPQARLWLGYHLLLATPWGVMPLVRRLTAWRMHSPHTHRRELNTFHRLMRETTRAGYLARLRMLRDYDVRDRIAAIEAPVLYLAADRDHLVPSVKQAHTMSRLTRRATVRILRGHGHTCLIAPDLDLATILDEWTRELASGDRQ